MYICSAQPQVSSWGRSTQWARLHETLREVCTHAPGGAAGTLIKMALRAALINIPGMPHVSACLHLKMTVGVLYL